MDKSQCFIPKRFKWNYYLCKGKKNRNNTLNIGRLLRFSLLSLYSLGFKILPLHLFTPCLFPLNKLIVFIGSTVHRVNEILSHFVHLCSI